VTADFVGGEAGEEERETLGDGDEEAKATERGSEEDELDAGEKGREGRINDVSPGEVTGAVEGEKLVAMETVAAVDGDVEKVRAAPKRMRKEVYPTHAPQLT
jgi:hypothetical protein